MTRWAILTGEYPPRPGGVADYTRLVATGLAAAGDSVTVYTPPCSLPAADDAAVTVRCLPDHFGMRGLQTLDRELSTHPRPDRILVQYVPQAFGWKAMNVAFAAWLANRASRIAEVWVMFHEVMASTDPSRVIRNGIMTQATRQMARWLARSASRVFVSIPAWGTLLRRIARTAPSAEWLPIPSNMPARVAPEQVAHVRSQLPARAVVLGHFGMFGGMNAHILAPAITELLSRDSRRVGLLVGRGSVEFRDRITATHPELAKRMLATGELAAKEVSVHLAACDVMIQPYPDGASTRRTSLMSGLALGVPTVTNLGFLSEPIWESQATGLTLATSATTADLVQAAESLLALPAIEHSARGRVAAEWYQRWFAPELTIARLRSPAPQR